MQSPVLPLARAQTLDDSWGKLAWFASQALGNCSTMTLGRAVIRAGVSNPVHRHPNCDEVLHLLSGRIFHTLGEEQYILEVGDTIAIPAGVWHNAGALDGKDAEMVICFSAADRQTEFAAV